MRYEVKLHDRRNFRNLFGSTSYYAYFGVSLAIVLVTWYFQAHRLNYVITFPYLEDVLAEFFHAWVDPYFWNAFLITFSRVLKGVGIAVVIGFPLGMVMGFSPFILRVLAPYVNAVRQVPVTAWAPMAIIWFGLGNGPTIFIIALNATFTVVLTVIGSVQEISPDYYNAVRSMGANTKDVLLDVVVPGCTTGLITGMRMALCGAWMTVM